MSQDTKPCARCNAAPRVNQSYCADCRLLNSREYTARHKQQRSDKPCARCYIAPRNSPTPSYCMDCYSAVQKAAHAAYRAKPKPPRGACSQCGKPMTGKHHAYCLACCRLQRTEWLDRNKATTEPCARCREAPRLEHMSYCRACHRALAKESRERTGGKKPQEFCSRCGDKRTGRHPTYCPPCNALYKLDRAKLPCARCGEQRTVSPGTHPSYCYTCSRDRWLLGKYGITSKQYDEMLASQDGRCAICRTEANGRTWHVDHDHGPSGQVRGILCDICNRGIGSLKDDPEILHRAAEYLKAAAK